MGFRGKQEVVEENKIPPVACHVQDFLFDAFRASQFVFSASAKGDLLRKLPT